VELGRLKTILANIHLKYCQIKREIYWNYRDSSKKAMENKCWKERGMKHTHLHRWTCASGKSMIPRHKWSPRYRIAHGWKIWVWIYHQGTWELVKQKEPRSIFIIFYYYFISFSFFLSLSFFFSFFFLFSLTFIFFSSYFFHFSFFFLLLLRTFCNIILT
jgi:hypothetical protein